MKLLCISWSKRPNKSDLHYLMVCGIALIYRTTLHAPLSQIPMRNSGCLCGISRISINKQASDPLSHFWTALDKKIVRNDRQRKPKPGGFIWWQGFQQHCWSLRNSWTFKTGSVPAGLCHSWVQQYCMLAGSDSFLSSCARSWTLDWGITLASDFWHWRPEGLSG